MKPLTIFWAFALEQYTRVRPLRGLPEDILQAKEIYTLAANTLREKTAHVWADRLESNLAGLV
jgi:hypothetical protein